MVQTEKWHVARNVKGKKIKVQYLIQCCSTMNTCSGALTISEVEQLIGVS